MKTPTVKAFRNPLIINLNKLLEKETNYILEISGNPKTTEEIISIYVKEDDFEPNNNKVKVIIRDNKNKTYQAKIDKRVTNILFISTSYNEYFEEFSEFYIKKLHFFEFESFPEDTPDVLAEPKYITFKKKIFEVDDYEQDVDQEDLEYEEEVRTIEIHEIYSVKEETPKIEDVLKSEFIVFFTSGKLGAEKLYFLTEQGIYPDANYKIINHLLKNLGENELYTVENQIIEKFKLYEIILRVFYNYNSYYALDFIKVKISLDEWNYYYDTDFTLENLNTFINKKVVEGLLKYFNLIEKHIQYKDLGFHNNCHLELKEVLNYVPNELINSIKSGVDPLFLKVILESLVKTEEFKVKNIVEILEINLKRGYTHNFKYDLVDNKLILWVYLKQLEKESLYSVKIMDKDMVKKILKFLTEDHHVIDLARNLILKKSYCEKILNSFCEEILKF